MGLASFQIRLSPGEVAGQVNGVDLSTLQVRRCLIDAGTGEIPQIILEAGGDVEIEGEGIVQIGSTLDEELAAKAVRTWVESLEPGPFESALLEALDSSGFGQITTGQAAIQVLREWTGG